MLLRLFVLIWLCKRAISQVDVHAGGGDPCVSMPSMDQCSTYQYPATAAQRDVDNLCRSMHFMPACSVNTRATTRITGLPGTASSPFSLLATVCNLDSEMTRMSGCTNYTSMCSSNSKIMQCQGVPGLASLPTTKTVNTQVRSICEEMSMDGCKECKPSWDKGENYGQCDLLDVYGRLCYEMPGMPQCGAWNTMCAATPTLWACHGTRSAGGAAAAPPVMRMYFFSDVPFQLLFKTWIPHTPGELCGAWFAMFALAMVYEYLQMAYGKWEAGFHKRLSAAAPGLGCNAGAAAGVGCCLSGAGRDVEQGKAGPIAESEEQQCDVCTGAGRAVADGTGVSSSSNCLQDSAAAVAAAAAPFASAARYCGKPSCCSARGSQQPVLAKGASKTALLNGSSCKSAESTTIVRAPTYPKSAASIIPRCAEVSGVGCKLLLGDVIRGLARFVLAGLAYLLMLAVMSFHVGMFFAVVSGLAVGSMLFGRWRVPAGVNEGHSHCGCGSS